MHEPHIAHACDDDDPDDPPDVNLPASTSTLAPHAAAHSHIRRTRGPGSLPCRSPPCPSSRQQQRVWDYSLAFNRCFPHRYSILFIFNFIFSFIPWRQLNFGLLYMQMLFWTLGSVSTLDAYLHDDRVLHDKIVTYSGAWQLCLLQKCVCESFCLSCFSPPELLFSCLRVLYMSSQRYMVLCPLSSLYVQYIHLAIWWAVTACCYDVCVLKIWCILRIWHGNQHSWCKVGGYSLGCTAFRTWWE